MDATDTDPARMLDRKMAEGRKEVAAIQIHQTKIAAREAGVLALLNPAGGLSFAKYAAKTLSGAMKTFGEAEKTIRIVEDDSIAQTAPDEVTAIAHDIYERTTTLDVTDEGRREVDTALARLPDRGEADPSDNGEPAQSHGVAKLQVSTQIEALSVVRIEADHNNTAKTAKVEAERSQRMGEDAEVIKDGISGLRYLDRLIAASTRRLQEIGQLDARAARNAAEARTAWNDAIAATAGAALPIVQAGHSITPDSDS